jgi:hypothetical protein
MTATATIRVYADARDTLNLWCAQKRCSMPELMDKMIQFGIRQRDQAFYASLPKPSRFDRKLVRMKRSILPSVGKINRLSDSVYVE